MFSFIIYNLIELSWIIYLYILLVQVHLNKLECREKVNFFL